MTVKYVNSPVKSGQVLRTPVRIEATIRIQSQNGGIPAMSTAIRHTPHERETKRVYNFICA